MQKRRVSEGREGTTPLDLMQARKAAELRSYGYIQRSGGLYSVRQDESKPDEKEVYTLIARAFVDVICKRHIYSIPERINETAKPRGVVLDTYLAPPGREQDGQALEIYRSDMLSRTPQFFSDIHAVKPPHKRKHADFIDALESLAMCAPVEKRYNATGLILAEQDGGYKFLHPAGAALAPGGVDEMYRVQFPQNVASRLTSIRYGWPVENLAAEQSPAARIADYHTLLSLVNIAPGSTGYGDVLLGIAAFAPLSQACDTGGVWCVIHGLTGSMKSATSRLPLQCYAQIAGRAETSTVNLRELASTPYAIEQVLYYLPGMFAHLDDGLKGNNISQKEVDKFYKLLSAMGGHAVTRQGAKRGVWGQGEGGFGIEPYPRGSGVYTVETLPASEQYASDLARYVIVSLDGVESVDLSLLTALQDAAAAGAMNRITAGYIQFLLTRIDAVLESIGEREEYYRALGVHSRTPTSYAKIETGLASFLAYGVEIGALSTQDAAARINASRARLKEVALRQAALMGIDGGQHAAENDAVTVFYKLLRQVMREHSLYVSDASRRAVQEYGGDGNGNRVVEYRPQPPLFLTAAEQDDDEQKLAIDETADRYGWRWNENARLYEPAPNGIEAGVLKYDGGAVTLHCYVSDFKEILYPVLLKTAKSLETPLPGVHELISKLKTAKKLTSIESTSLHGRRSKRAGVYILDMMREEKGDDPLPAGDESHLAAEQDGGGAEQRTEAGAADHRQDETTAAEQIARQDDEKHLAEQNNEQRLASRQDDDKHLAEQKRERERERAAAEQQYYAGRIWYTAENGPAFAQALEYACKDDFLLQSALITNDLIKFYQQCQPRALSLSADRRADTTPIQFTELLRQSIIHGDEQKLALLASNFLDEQHLAELANVCGRTEAGAADHRQDETTAAEQIARQDDEKHLAEQMNEQKLASRQDEKHAPAYARKSKGRTIMYANLQDGQGLTAAGNAFCFSPDSALSLLHAAAEQEQDAARTIQIYACGTLPGNYAAYLMDSAIFAEYRTGKRGMYFDVESDTEHVARYEHRLAEQQIEIRPVYGWLGESGYSIQDAAAAFDLLNSYLAHMFTQSSKAFATPALTFSQLWTEYNRINKRDFPVLAENVRALIRENSGQGRIELLTPAGAKSIDGLYYYDGIFKYAAHSWGLPTEVAEHDDKNEYADKIPARYRIAYTVPSDWQHVGVFMTPRTSGDGWFFPGDTCKSETFETWVDGAEIDALIDFYMPASTVDPRADKEMIRVDKARRYAIGREKAFISWRINILERIIFKTEKDAAHKKPLDEIVKRLRDLRAKVERDAAEQTDETQQRRYKLVRGMLRAIVLHGIGSFNRHARNVTVITRRGEIAPDGYIDVKPTGELDVYTVPAPLESYSTQLDHPEYCAAIWARTRASMTRAALAIARDEIVSIRTDAIATTKKHPEWNGTRVGELREKWHIAKKLPAPQSMEQLDKLIHKYVKDA